MSAPPPPRGLLSCLLICDGWVDGALQGGSVPFISGLPVKGGDIKTDASVFLAGPL